MSDYSLEKDVQEMKDQLNRIESTLNHLLEVLSIEKPGSGGDEPIVKGSCGYSGGSCGSNVGAKSCANK